MTREQKIQFDDLMATAVTALNQAVALAGIHSLPGQHALACANLAKIKMHCIGSYADGDDLRALHGNVTDLCRAIDPLMEMIGEEAADNATRHFDREVFKDVMFNAVDGMALYELRNAAENADEDAAENEENDRADDYYKLNREMMGA
jgi:hypothetical protein